MKVVVNRCYGGFGVSEAVYEELGLEWDGYGYLDNKSLGIASDDYKAYRFDARLIDAIQKVGLEEAASCFAELEIIDIPDDVEWEIKEYDGREWVAEKHRTW